MTTPLKVLLLEDQPDDAQMMLYALKSAGFELNWTRVDTQADYLAQLHSGLDVILADYHLPQFDALRALQLLQAQGLDIPFIVVTGATSEEVAVECIKQGATDYLLKDRLSRLGPAVARALEQKRLGEEKQAAEAALLTATIQQQENLQRRLQESEALAAISRALNETLDPKRIFQMIVDFAKQIIPQVERAVIHLLNEERQALTPVAVAGLSELGHPGFTMRPGEGVAGHVMAQGIVINVGDIQTDPRYLRLGPATHLRSLLVAPVQSGPRRLGTLSLQSAAPHAFSADDERLLATLGIQAALAIENARLFEVEYRRAEEAEALQQVTQTFISRFKLREMLPAVVEAIATIAYNHAAIFLLDGDRLVLQASQGQPAPRRTVLERGLINEVVRTGQPALIPTGQLEADLLEIMPGIQSAIVAPIVHAGQALGALMVGADADRALDQSDLNWVVTVGRQLGVAIENTRLVADLEKALQQEKVMRDRLVQSEKLAAMGRMVASVAHELNNPLQAIQNALFLVKQEDSLSPQSQEDMQVALTEADRMADLIKRLRDTYRPVQAEQFRPESLNSIISEVQRLVSTHLRHSGIQFTFEPNPDLPFTPGMRDQLKQVVLNLSLNAVEAMSNGGQLTICTHHLSATHEILVTFTDTGAGIDPKALPNIFDPFFTTKEGGTGLGLAITYDIIQRHAGRIEVESELGRGTTFKVWLPVDKSQITVQNSSTSIKA